MAEAAREGDESPVTYERREHVAVITLNQPGRMNALGRALVAALQAALTRFDEDREAWVGVLTGSGKAFCAGGDLQDMKGSVGRGTDWADSIQYLLPLFEQLDAVDKPLIAAVNGYCLGGGFGLAHACPLIVAAESAVFGMPETAYGLPNYSYFDVWKTIGARRLFEISLTAQRFSARQALEMGFVNRAVPDEQLMPAAFELAERIAQNSPLAVAGAARAIKFTFHHGREEWASARKEIWAPVLGSEDLVEGLTAFQERRKPRWRNR